MIVNTKNRKILYFYCACRIAMLKGVCWFGVLERLNRIDTFCIASRDPSAMAGLFTMQCKQKKTPHGAGPDLVWLV